MNGQLEEDKRNARDEPHALVLLVLVPEARVQFALEEGRERMQQGAMFTCSRVAVCKWWGMARTLLACVES